MNKNDVANEPYMWILLKAMRKSRRPVSTRWLAIRTRMDWSTAKKKLTVLHLAGKVHTKKHGSKRLWSTTKIVFKQRM